MSEEGSAQRAFDDLRAEISVLRRSVEALPQAWRENRPPDYTEDLARVVKAMNTVGTHMEAIEASPTLKMTPQAYGKGIREAGLAVSQEMQAAFEKAIAEVQRERQSWWLLGVGLVCFMVGLGASPVLTSLLPSSVGTRVASFIVGEKDRWHSGAMMMEIDNPEGWQQVIQASQLVEANKDRITACQKAASSLEKGQKNCQITVQARQE